MSELTNEQKHRLMWTELSLTGSNNKRSTQVFQLHAARDACYACEEAKERNGGSFVDRCKECPIHWTDDQDHRFPCLSSEALFNDWSESPVSGERKVLAAKIAALPWRQPVCNEFGIWEDKDQAPKGCSKFLHLRDIGDAIELCVMDVNGYIGSGHLMRLAKEGGCFKTFGSVGQKFGLSLDTDGYVVVEKY